LHHFRIATINDRENLLLFLKDQWNSEHIYLKSDLLFDYDYLFGNNLNFLLAINEDGQIDGILGFILYSQEYKGSDIFTVLWKARPKSGDPMLGLTLLEKLVTEFGFRIVSTVGANAKTLPLYEFMGYTTGQLKHYFILNDRFSEFKICKNAATVVDDNKQVVSPDKKLIPLETYDTLVACFQAEKYKERIPYKSPQYIEKRYFNHPFYAYKVFGITAANGVVNSILVTREIVQDESKILRVVDFVGDESDLNGMGTSLKAYLYANGYEYIDFQQYGIDHDAMTAAGFLLKDNYEGLIIPHYFDPFQQSNVSINFFTTSQDKFYIFKADGDQDRPNRLLKLTE
jgi:hypothetical protein